MFRRQLQHSSFLIFCYQFTVGFHLDRGQGDETIEGARPLAILYYGFELLVGEGKLLFNVHKRVGVFVLFQQQIVAHVLEYGLVLEREPR